MNVCVVGLGLLGGSFALAMKEKFPETNIIGVDKNPENADKALKLGIADEIKEYDEGISTCDLAVLATPVNVMHRQLPEALDLLDEKAILIDFGSTKEALCEIAENHPKRGRYVALHPIAGTENSGPEAAFAHLLHNKMMIFCEVNRSDKDAVDLNKRIFKSMNMHLSYMGAAEHDLHIAYVSHLSHISSFALGLTVLEKEKNEKNIFNMAGSGFSSTVRLAKSSPEMWAPIFKQNGENISEALDAYIQKLVEFKEIIDNRNDGESLKEMRKANEIRRVLAGIQKKKVS
ncbi:prephenate dehydrogenase [Fulvitalea axinellae]|uniref:Prephenate dehydrogenase n=1 Tax=Fulvitalea axinellae TaxID=1182444 RepID=A0AAU9CAG2_9BACT|nr:prephenate dehydrogenase [Fulvitalea axinellae]